MPNGRLYRFLIRFADIRPNEARQALGFFFYFFLITLSIYVIKPVKESFLIGITPAWWPYADFITAALIGLVVTINDRFVRLLPRKIYFFRITAFLTLSLIILWIIFEAKLHSDASGSHGIQFNLIEKIWPIPVFIFNFWADIFIVMSVTHFWVAVNDRFKLHQAKRIISFYITGGLLGGIVGSILTAQLVPLIGPVNLLLLCPIIFLVNLYLTNSFYSQDLRGEKAPDSLPAKRGFFSRLRMIGGDKYLRVLTGFFASAVITASLVNYQFKIVLKEAIPDDGARASFLGKFFLIILLISAVFHLLTTGPVLKRFGIRSSLLMAPIVLLAACMTGFLIPASSLILWACAIRGCEKIFDCTISQSVRELLYMPIHASLKYQVKTFIDMFINKLAVGFGAIVFWILYRTSSFAHKSAAEQAQQLSILVIAFAAISILLIWNIYTGYMQAVKKDLSRKWEDAHSILADRVDLDAARLVVDALQSREKSSTLYAMSLFQMIRKDGLSPEMISILSYTEDELKADSMDALLDVPCHVLHKEIEDTLADRRIIAEVQEIVALESYESIMEKRLTELSADENASEVERMEAAKLIGILRATPAVRLCLRRLLQDTSLDVLVYALDSAAVHRISDNIPLIIRLLGNPVTMQPAQDALSSYGSGIEESLSSYLRDPNENLNIRNSIPEIFARLKSQESADLLCLELAHGTEDIKQSVIDALYQIHSDQPRIQIRKKIITDAVYTRIGRIYDIYLAGYGGQLSGNSSALGLNWKMELDLATKQIFDLLSLVYPTEDIVKAYQNILQGTGKSFDSSLELLDNVLDADLKELLFPIIDDIPPEYKAEQLRRLRRSLDKHLSQNGDIQT